MEYVKLYVSLRDDPKVLDLSDRAFRAYVTTLLWCGQHETDGVISKGLLSQRTEDELLRAGLVDDRSGACVVHNWHKFQRTKAQLEAVRAASRKANGVRWSSEPDTEPESDSYPEVEVEVEEDLHKGEARPADAAVENTTKQLQDTAYLLGADSKCQHFLRKLRTKDERWESVSNGALIKLARKYGADVVVTALGFMSEEGATPIDPYPYLESVCVRIENEAVTA